MSLVKKAVRGATWTTATSLLARVFGLVATLLVTHRITPAEFGQASASIVVVTSVSWFSSLWLGNYLIFDRQAGRPAAWLASWAHQLVGAVALLAMLPFGQRIAVFVHAPEMVRYLPWAAIAIAIERLGSVPEKLIVRDLRFRELALGRMVSEMGYGIVTFGAAWLGLGGMSLICGVFARSLLRSGIFMAVVPWREWAEPQPFDPTLARRMIGYTMPLWFAGIATYIGTNWDNLLVSHYFGPGVMAAYSLSFNFTDMPAAQIGEQLSEVLLPSFVLLEVERRRVALVKSLLVVSLITFPIAVGLGTVSTTLVRAIFDARWGSSPAPMIAILSGRTVARVIVYPIIQYLQASNRTRAQMYVSAAQTALLLAVIAGLGSTSPLATCFGVVACNFVIVVSTLVLVGREGVSVSSIVAGLVRVLVACGIMSAAVLAVRHVLAPRLPHPTPLLLVEIAVGALVYPLAALLVCPSEAHDLLSWVKRGFGRREAEAA